MFACTAQLLLLAAHWLQLSLGNTEQVQAAVQNPLLKTMVVQKDYALEQVLRH